MHSDFTNREKEVVKQSSEKEESVKKRGKYKTWSVTENLKLVNMPYDMELHQF